MRILLVGALSMLLLAVPGGVLADGGGGGGGGGGGDAGWQTVAPDVTADARKAIDREDYESALALLVDAEAKEPGNADIFNLRGYALRKLERYDEAGAAYDTALSLDPDHEGALEYQGELFLTLGMPGKAKRNVARLDDLCFFDCSIRDKLQAAVDAYKASY